MRLAPRAMAKRCFDIVCALTGIIVFAPVFLLVALVVRLDSPGPIFYRGTRSGLGGKPFRIFKFRTMIVEAEHAGGHSTALHDPRLTPAGRFIRKYKLDELPQFFNIIAGDMSFVGPRPQVVEYTRLYKGEELRILDVRPGLTDFASIHFIHLDKLLGDDNVDEKYMREVEPVKNILRLKYVQEQSFATDIKILVLTLLAMFRIRSLWNTQK